MRYFVIVAMLFVVLGANKTDIGQIVSDEVVSQLDLNDKFKKIDNSIGKENVWIKQFYNHQEYLDLQHELAVIEKKKNQLAKRKDQASKDELAQLEGKIAVIQSKLQLTGEIGSNGMDLLAKVNPIAESPEIKNPFAIIGGLSYIKENKKILDEYKRRLGSLKATLDLIAEKRTLLEQAQQATQNDKSELVKELKEIALIETLLDNTYDLFLTALTVQERRYAANIVKIENSIKTEVVKLINISIVIAVIIVLGFLVKFVVSRAMQDSSRLFSIKRTINIVIFIIVVLILLFNYISNIVYFVTLLGFISAGIAIAMKDWFMSLLGWLVMGVTGSIKVGDRIRVVFNGEPIVADVLEIGLIKLKLFVDVSLNSVEYTRRAGQIVYFPNGLIFTNVIQNYTYDKLKTVWDGIDIVVTFDTNHQKAQKIARDIALKHTSGFMNITRKHYAYLRERFNLRTINHEPRVFAIMDKYGIRISVWYLASSYGVLSLRTLISTELVDAYNHEEDIKIAYPTYSVGTNGDTFIPQATPYPS